MTRTKNKTSRARVDQPVNRIEFNRLQPAVKNVPEADASGASGPVYEKENKSGSVGSNLSPPMRKSSSKRSFKTKSPKSAPARVVAEFADTASTPRSKSKHSGRSGGRKSRKSPSSAPAVVQDSFLSILEGSEGNSLAGSEGADLPSIRSADAELAQDSVVLADGRELNFDSPFPCVAAAVGKNHLERN